MIIAILFILVFLGFVIAAVSQSKISKRKCAYLALSLSFLCTAWACTFVGFKGDDGPGTGFYVMFLMIAVFLLWLVLISFAFNSRPAVTFAWGYAALLLALFLHTIYLRGFDGLLLVTFLAIVAFYELANLLIYKAKTKTLKIIAVLTTLASYALPVIAISYL